MPPCGGAGGGGGGVCVLPPAVSCQHIITTPSERVDLPELPSGAQPTTIDKARHKLGQLETNHVNQAKKRASNL